MSRIEEKLYLQSVFDAIDEVYNLKNRQKSLTYEERLRASFSKLLIPDWYNPDYTSINELRKTKSFGQVPRLKFVDFTNDESTSSLNNSPRLSNGIHQHRSPSRSRSERAPLRRNSTASSCDTNGTITSHGRRLTTSSTYAPGMQRVAQSSTWYKPKTFVQTNSKQQCPQPLPRLSKINQERQNLTKTFSPSSINQTISNESVRHPIKPRTMTQAPIPVAESAFLDTSPDSDLTIIPKVSTSSSRPIDDPSLNLTHLLPSPHIVINSTTTNLSMTSTIPRNDSSKSISSQAESYASAVLPAMDKNLLGTDSSSYASVNDQCLSTSSSSYHTAIAGDASSSSSMTGYETPTPQLDDETLSSHSSISDLSHAETLEPNTEDLDIVAVSTGEQKTAIIPSVDVGMENLPLPPFASALPNTSSSSTTSDNSPSTESRPNWYEDGSTATCIDQTSPQTPQQELREISNDQLLHEVDLNGVNDEFFLFSPGDTHDDQLTHSITDENLESIDSPLQTSKRIYTVENQIFNDDLGLMDDFHCSSTVDPFGSNQNNNNSSIMITNLDDILIDDDDDEDDGEHLKDTSTYLLNTNYRRPIQEDILYEVEHENSYSDHSQNTSSIVIADNNTSIKIDPNLDFLTSMEQSSKNRAQKSTASESLSLEKTFNLNPTDSPSKQTNSDNQTLPIYILPPVYTATTSTGNASTLRIDTNTNPSSYRWNSSLQQYSALSALSSPSSSYTSKIRQRHYSVGSYYDNKTTTVALHPNHTLYIIGSAPVSPISRTSTTSSESHYHAIHHSPVSYGNVAFNALRRINPFLETNIFTSNYDYPPSPSSDRNDHYRVTPPAPIPSHSLTETKQETFTKNEPPTTPPKTSSTSPSSPPHPVRIELEQPLVRPKTSRGRPPENPPPPPPPPPPPLRSELIEKSQPSTNVYQEIDSTSTDDEQPSTTRSADIRFIRGTIERVFDFHGESTSEVSTNDDEASTDNKNDNESVSTSNSSKTVSKKNDQYPAVEAVQRFYDTKSPSISDKKKFVRQQPTTNLDDLPASNHSSESANLFARSHPINPLAKDLSKSSDNEQATSEEIDDTLNDIEDDDSQEEKFKRPTTNESSRTSNESSPSHLSDNQTNDKKTSQETQTLQRQNPIILTTRSPSGSQSTVQSYETAHSSVPPLDIVTQMIIERTDGIDDGRITEISGDMVIFYDDIEIVEHSSDMSSTESESRSSISKSLPNSRPIQTIIESHPPPPIPARTLKPLHLLNSQQQSPSKTQTQQAVAPSSTQPPSKINRTYELEKANIRKKFDVNSVNDRMNRYDYPLAQTVPHRLPSARHFVGKLNGDEPSSQNPSINDSQTPIKPSQAILLKSQTLPVQPVITTNGHSTNPLPQSPSKNSSATLPIRSSSTVGINGKPRSTMADTNALVKQIQNSLSRNSLHDSHVHSPLSVSTKDLRTFVSSTYSPDENMIDDDGVIHTRQGPALSQDEQAFQRQARLSKSFHNVSEYNSIDQYPKTENQLNVRTQPSKSVENNLNHLSPNTRRHSQMPIHFPPIVASTSFSALPHSEDHARLLSMKWYTGQVSENSEICYNTPQTDHDDLLFGYISRHSNREIQSLLARLQASNDIRIHAALDDIRLRIAQFDASKSQDELPVFMRYLESRLRDISNKNPIPSTTTSSHSNGQRRISNGGNTNGYSHPPQPDTISIKSRTSSIGTGLGKETPPSRQLGRQHLRSTGNLAGGGTTNGHHPPLPPPRRASQSSANQENPAVFDDMLNTVLGLPKKGAATLPQAYSSNRDKSTPLAQTQMTANQTTPNKPSRDIGKRLFESGTYKDPRLLYDGPRKNEKEEQPLETSV